jgi:hypothetical protein
MRVYIICTAGHAARMKDKRSADTILLRRLGEYRPLRIPTRGRIIL